MAYDGHAFYDAHGRLIQVSAKAREQQETQTFLLAKRYWDLDRVTNYCVNAEQELDEMISIEAKVRKCVLDYYRETYRW
jgi:hypothetical protein